VFILVFTIAQLALTRDRTARSRTCSLYQAHPHPEIVTILAALVLLAPFWILIAGAFKTGNQIPDHLLFAPDHPTFG
jgi:hypothetical protein